MMHRRRLFATLAAPAMAAFGAPPQKQLSVAAASNLTSLAPQLSEAFQQTTGIRVVFSFASTAQLSRQLQDGAPFDLFAGADAVHVDELVRQGVVVSASRAIYAIGILTLWFPKGDGRVLTVTNVADPGIRTIAVARPELAPYGAAAVETLRRAGLWDAVQRKIVYAGSVAMARQYGATGNADAVFAPKALVMHEKGSSVEIDERLHQPLTQALGVVTASKQQTSALAFADFLVKGKGHAILLANGYK